MQNRDVMQRRKTRSIEKQTAHNTIQKQNQRQPTICHQNNTLPQAFFIHHIRKKGIENLKSSNLLTRTPYGKTLTIQQM